MLTRSFGTRRNEELTGGCLEEVATYLLLSSYTILSSSSLSPCAFASYATALASFLSFPAIFWTMIATDTIDGEAEGGDVATAMEEVVVSQIP